MSGPEAGRMGRAVEETLGSLTLRPEDAALAEIARELARLMDAGVAGGRALEVFHKLSPRLTGVLRELGATPAAGGRKSRGGDDDDHDDDGEEELDELSQRRLTRQDRAAPVDPAAP